MDKFDNERAREDAYDLDDLIETFSRHAVELDAERKQRRNEWNKIIQFSHESELLDQDEFNLCRAFYSLAVEIRKLKEKESGNHAENAPRGIYCPDRYPEGTLE